MSENHTRSNIELKQVYNPEDVEGFDYSAKLGDPGVYPFTRGRHAGPSRGWIQRELSGEGEPGRSNEQFKYLLSKGQQGIDIIGDSPTQALLDPDHPLAKNAVGTQGVSVCCLNDYKELFKDLPLDTISVSSSLPSAVSIAGLYLTAKERGYSPEILRGSVIQWPFYTEDCSYAVHMPIPLRIRLAADNIEFCTKHMPKYHAFLEDTYFFSESGLTAVEEMALGFVEIRYLIRELVNRGLDIDSFAPRIAILVNCSMDFFEEIAKIRASRRLFARMMKEEFGAKDKRSQSVVITCHTSGLTLTAQQPFNNIVRGAVQTMALALAGVQAIEISAFDEAYRTPTPESHLVGLRTQQVIHLESNITNVSDPLGGSYYVESLTDSMEEKIWDMITDMEAKGTPAQLAEQGWFKKFFEDVMARYAKQVSDGEIKKVGLNCLELPEEEDILLKEVAESKFEPCWDQIEKITQFKKNRNQDKLAAMLKELHSIASAEKGNLMYPIIDAFEADATMEEIAGTLRTAYNHPYDPYGMRQGV